MVIIGLHFIANTTGLYETRIVWFDNIRHALAGIGFGLLWLWILEKRNLHISFVFSAALLIIFVLGTALVWELLEFLFLKQFTSYADSLSIYSPSLGEASADIVSNLVGAVILILVIGYKSRKHVR